MYRVSYVSLLLVALFVGSLANVVVMDASSEGDSNLDSDTSDWLDETDADYGSESSEFEAEREVGPVVIPPGTRDILGHLVDNSKVIKEIKVNNGGERGTWGRPQFCPIETYAAGYAMKIQNNPRMRDESGLNGIELFCKDNVGRLQVRRPTSTIGIFGDWDRTATYCRNKDFMTTFKLQVQKRKWYIDNTAANFVAFMCRGGINRDGRDVYEIVRSPGHGKKGSWGTWSGSCDRGSAICGIKTKVESHIGKSLHSALNDVIFYCCKL